MTEQAEQQTEWITSNALKNNGWTIDNTPSKNVYFQKPKQNHQHLLKTPSKSYKKPDYILYHGDQPIGIIEVKRPGDNLDTALAQAIKYGELLNAPLIFASNGAFVQTHHLFKQKPLFINDEEVRKIISYKQAIKFIEENSNEITTIAKKFTKEDLIKIFKKVNDILRKANILSGFDRISEFSTILFLKLISEKEGEKSYWQSIKQQSDDLLFSHLNNTVIKDLENKYGGGVFSDINITKPSLFREIMNMIDPLILSDLATDVKGDAFEYFLKNMNQADNDLGQYFTPRHIVDAMVNLVEPKFKEKIYDPFCGTGGFLIQSFKYVKENNIINTEEDKKLLQEHMLFGNDATKVSTIAKKNMILHGDGHSNVREIDSLENPQTKKADIVITNIPFSLKNVDYSHLYFNGLGKKNGDAICILHCLDALAEGGRMAIIVPEGFLFKKELRRVREILLNTANLELVISLPQGVFQPYTGVKTDILYFTNAYKPKPQTGFYYFEVKNDGFSLDAHRRKLEGLNDIKILEANDLSKPQKEILLNQGFEFIKFDQIKENDYNLVGTRYRELVKHTGKYETVSLGQYVSTKYGYTAVSGCSGDLEYIRTTDIVDSFSLKLTDKKYVNFFDSYQDFLLQHNDILIARSGSVGKNFIYLSDEKNVIFASYLVRIRCNETIINPRYLIYFLNTKEYWQQVENLTDTLTQPNFNAEKMKQIQIPLPPLSVQQEIVDQLDTIQKVITNAQNLINNLRSGGNDIFQTINSENYEMVKLKDIIKIYRGASPRPISKYTTNNKDGTNWLKIGDIKEGEKYIYKTQDKISVEGTKYSRLAKIGDFILSNSMSFGRPYIMQIDACIHDGWLLFTNFNALVNKHYLYYVISSDWVKTQFVTHATGSTVKNLNIKIVENIQIPLPPLSVQQQIVDEMDAELNYIKQTEQLIEKQKQKMESIISSLWQSEIPESIS